MRSFYIAGEKKLWSYKELESMQSDGFESLLAEIPSDCESIASDLENVLNDEVEVLAENTIQDDELFPIENMDIIFDNSEMQTNNQITNNEDYDWDSEDDVPLSVLRAEIIKNSAVIWTNNMQHITKPNEFVEDTGPDIPENLETPTDIFLHLFSEDMINHIVFQTNLYAIQKNGGGNNFIPTTNDEIKKFLGVNMIMGIKQMPSYRDYWSSREDLRDTFISQVMTRDRFSWLLGNIHIADNSVQPQKNHPNYDKLYKLRPLITKINDTFRSSLRPSEFQSVDESMIKFKGRSSIKQYMPMKPTKRGYKLWVRADLSGYMCEFQVYTGKIVEGTEKNLGRRVVRDLTKQLIGKHHKVFFDNYFNSVDLQRELLATGIYASGTIRKGRRNFPELIPDKKMKRGETCWKVSTDGLVAIKWMDRRSVLLLANFQNPSLLETASRRNKEGVAQDIPCPKIVKDYNKHMGYVDRFDMLKSLYEIDRKSHKWWHRIFFYLVDACVVNALILFHLRSHSKSLTLKIFRLSVARGLIGVLEPTKRGRSSLDKTINHFKRVIPPEVRYDRCAHMPVRTTSRRCAHCSTTSEVHRTIWKCQTCDVGLCLQKDKNCFLLFHKK